MESSASSFASAPKAGWWARFFALFLDNLIIGIPATIILVVVGAAVGSSSNGSGTVSGVASGIVLLVLLLVLVASVAYFIYFWTKDGRTLGNRALNIRVVRKDGSQFTVGTAVVRYIGYIVDSILFGIPLGYIWAAFDNDKQAWHDKMAGTIVVKT